MQLSGSNSRPIEQPLVIIKRKHSHEIDMYNCVYLPITRTYIYFRNGNLFRQELKKFTNINNLDFNEINTTYMNKAIQVKIIRSI